MVDVWEQLGKGDQWNPIHFKTTEQLGDRKGRDIFLKAARKLERSKLFPKEVI